MQPLSALTPAIARALTGLFTDIDGTLTHQGKLPAHAYAALWRLQEAGLKVVPITGRPAGWCDLIARQWPVDGVIGENGALAFYEDAGRLVRLYHPAVAKDDVRARLTQVRDEVLREIPGARVAKDQFARMFDLAIDFAEEAPDLGLAVAEKIRQCFVRHGAIAKVSHIHVNGWFGDYDKLAMTALFVRTRWQLELGQVRERFVFCGDSPNDEPMFAYFPHACGVANVQAFGATLHHPPTYVAAGEGASGFVEIANRILTLRGAKPVTLER